jgi:SAM-dependent methyltransferase
MNMAQVWEVCLCLEYDKSSLVDGLDGLLSEYRGKSILDCACGTGFAVLDLIKRGYRITCSDGSETMLQEFRRNSRRMEVEVAPHLIVWSDLASNFRGMFDVVMCRGSSLIYGASWEEEKESSEEIIVDALMNFFQCLKPGGILYLDTTQKEYLIESQEQIFDYPEIKINGVSYSLSYKQGIERDKKRRKWEGVLIKNGHRYSFTRYSLYLPHDELKDMMMTCGFTNIREVDVMGEYYDVYIGEKPKQ